MSQSRRQISSPDPDAAPFAGRTALITGAASPLGEAIARRLNDAGARVILHGRADNLKLFDLAKRLPSARAFAADLSDPDAVDKLAGFAAENHTDILINNASIYERMPLDTLTREQFDATLRVNLIAPVTLTRRIAASLRPDACADIVCLGDAYTARPYSGYAPYFISKAALNEAVAALALELAPRVRVNAVAIGLTETAATNKTMTREKYNDIIERIPLGRAAKVDEVVDAVIFLLRARYCTGTILTLDGGRCLR